MKNTKIATMVLVSVIISISMYGCAAQTPNQSMQTEITQKEEVSSESVVVQAESPKPLTSDELSIWFNERQNNPDYAEAPRLLGSTWGAEQYEDELYYIAFLPMDSAHPLASIGGMADSAGYALLYSKTEYAYGYFTKGATTIEIAFMSPQDINKEPMFLGVSADAKAVGNYNMSIAYNTVTEKLERVIWDSNSSEEAIYSQDDCRDLELLYYEGEPDPIGW